MYSSFCVFFPVTITLPTFQPLSLMQAYPSSLYSYAQLSPLETNPPSLQMGIEGTSNHEASLKQEDLSSKPQSETPKKPSSRFRYPKKNVESNVVNQCYSFLTTRAKSLEIVSQLLDSEEKIDIFYQLMKQGRKKQTKYMGRSVLQNLLLLEDDHPVYILYKKLRYKMALKINELRCALRIAVYYFLKNMIVPAILTSSKLDRTTVQQHLVRAREILAYLSKKSIHQ